ncbi:MAG: hypothetical protein A2Z18_06760 [Armatimonadetes bacterium RBG_16_58_9]|nr:MAG: hypothetical protein A2Z18_06760 [Armatimonadetes bacterium RBG_16_58_9]
MTENQTTELQRVIRLGHVAAMWGLLVAPFSYVWTVLLASIFSGWVGASYKPVPAIMYLAYLPALVSLATGIYVLCYRAEGKSLWTYLEGVFTIVAGLLTPAFVYFAIAMLSIG